MRNYCELLKLILDTGAKKEDRTGTGTLSIFGHQMRFNLADGFPLVTQKKVIFRSVVYELLWMLRGDTNIKFLRDNGVGIWNNWADENGELGPVYGKQWTRWGAPGGLEINQISNIIKQIKTSPDSRRLIVNAWNVGELDAMALPPCPVMFQFYVSPKKELSCQVYQRSADCFLGLPFDIASYALLTHMIAQVCKLEVGELIYTCGDAHIYLNHIEQVKLMLAREERPLPKLILKSNVDDIFKFKHNDIMVLDYNPHPFIKADIAV